MRFAVFAACLWVAMITGLNLATLVFDVSHWCFIIADMLGFLLCLSGLFGIILKEE